MCGISGIVADTIQSGILERMTQTLEHRGPDGEGHWYGDGIALGHRRLAILDLSARGAQPMHYAQRYVITYNGEVYNYRELRRELESEGRCFETATDTEVILAAFDRWGPECLSRFNGMWAFAIFDRLRRRLFLARDRFGVKPLYYARKAGGFIFASEVKALFAHPAVSRTPNIDYCHRYIAYGPRDYDGPTAWLGVDRLESGHYVDASLAELVEGRFVARRYWKLEPSLDDAPYEAARASAAAEHYAELLRSAVDLRLRADVKVGSALSGGLDSSSIVLLINEALRARGAAELQETFSCVYRTPGAEYCDESRHINVVASALGVRSNQIEPVSGDVPTAHRAMIYHLDTPPESTLMSSWYTFMLVGRTPVVVTLDGQGADEQLAGYHRYIASHLAYSRSAWREARALLSVPGSQAFVLLGLAGRATRLAGAGWLVPMLLRWARKQIFDGDPLNMALVRDCSGGLQNLIHYADRTSMAFSIESRMPFLDFRLAEFLARLPASYKIHDGWTKHVARLAFDGRLPREIVWRRDKMGWPIPEALWFGGELKQWYCEQIESSGFLRELGVRADVRRALASGVPINRLTRLLNLATWHRVFVESPWRPEGVLSERVRRRST